MSAIKVKLVPLGVDIIDHTGEQLVGITESDAIDLFLALDRQMPRIRARIRKHARESGTQYVKRLLAAKP